MAKNPYRTEANNIRDQKANAPALAALKEVKAPPVASHGRPFDIWRDRASDKAWTVGRVEKPGVLFVVWRTNSKRDARSLAKNI
jgi:hypothetical protein